MVSLERKHASHRKHRLGHENHVFLLTLAAGALPVAACLILIWTGQHETKTQWTVTIGVVLTWLGFSLGVRSTVARPLQTLANMQAALREGDFSMRMRRPNTRDSLSDLVF